MDSRTRHMYLVQMDHLKIVVFSSALQLHQIYTQFNQTDSSKIILIVGTHGWHFGGHLAVERIIGQGGAPPKCLFKSHTFPRLVVPSIVIKWLGVP